MPERRTTSKVKPTLSEKRQKKFVESSLKEIDVVYSVVDCSTSMLQFSNPMQRSIFLRRVQRD